MKTSTLTILGFSIIPAVLAEVPAYGQCGGLNWTGETTCVSGYTCQYSNDWYSQCVPGTAAASSSTTTKTSSSSTTKTSSSTKTTTTTQSSSTGIPAGAITVGSGGKYSTLTAALQDTSSNVYYIYSGTYTGQVVINRANVAIYGETTASGSYTGNKVTLTASVTASQAGSNDASGTVRVLATGVKLYNLNVANAYGTVTNKTQAIALSVQAGQFGCYGCKLTGIQDTLLANKGTQVYAKSYISGCTDFIFGSSASIWITKSVIQTLAAGYITASGRSSDDANYYVIDHSTIQGTGSSYLGRPWKNYARVIYQYCTIGSNVPAAGWVQWSSSTPNTDHVTFGEYSNTGAGAWNSGRASFATQLSSPITITTVLGSGYTSWVDSTFL
ncbi:hypothetical protein FRC20_004912 [Serendipita sp. 405]|nr:hypothetical protein FRC15_005919 [Serendipita sp. 397]KAG8841637.1 hypothetical protein FRC20_004912 [Serendipita sp. 405]